MRIESFSFFSFWLVAFSLVASSSLGQYESKYNYQSPRLLETPGSHSIQSTPFGIEVRLFLKNQGQMTESFLVPVSQASGSVVKGELLFVDEESITILTPSNYTMTFQLKELSIIKGRFGRIAPRTRMIQAGGILSTITTGLLTIVTAPINLIISTAVNSSLRKSLTLISTNPEIDWRFLKTYSRYPAGWPNSQLTP
ncbi:MAG: hypothetical protein ACO2XQ_08775 [Flavobacteriales bacterium]